MKLLSFRLTAALFAAVLGVTSLAIAAEDAPEKKTQEEGAAAPADATKKATSKKPRGILADSFMWGAEKPAGKGTANSGGSTLPGVVASQRLPITEQGSVAPVVTAAA